MRYILFLILLTVGYPCLSSGTVIVERDFTSHKIEKTEFLIFEDPEHRFSPTSWNELIHQYNYFIPYDHTIGLSKSAWWTGIRIENRSTEKVTLYLYTDYTPLESVLLYQKNSEGLLIIDSIGCRIPFNSRKVKTNAIAFEVSLQPGINVVFFRVTSGIIKFPFTLLTPTEFLRRERNQAMYYSWLIGIIVVISASALVLVLYFRQDSLYLKYFCYLVLLLILIIAYIGYGFQYLWPDFYEWNAKAFMILGLLSFALHMYFAIDLLRVKQYSLRIYYFVTFFVVILSILSPILYFLNTHLALIIVLSNVFLIIPVTAVYLYHPIKHKQSTAYYYLAGYATFLLPTGLTILKYLKFMPFNDGINDHIFTGLVAEIIFFSIALGFRTKENLPALALEKELPLEGKSPRFITVNTLTKKENEIFNYVGQNMTDLEIVAKTGNTLFTVRYHLKNIYEKMGLKNRIMLLQKYEEECMKEE